jgi:hypothetical protein
MHRFALAFALAASAASVAGAHAQGKVYGYEADLAQPARRAAVTAGGVNWSCTGARCTASGRGGNVSVKGCSELARAVGPVAGYRSEIKTLAAGDLRECKRLAQGAAAGAAKAAKAPARPQRAATPEILFTGIAAGAESAAAERRP